MSWNQDQQYYGFGPPFPPFQQSSSSMPSNTFAAQGNTPSNRASAQAPAFQSYSGTAGSTPTMFPYLPSQHPQRAQNSAPMTFPPYQAGPPIPVCPVEPSALTQSQFHPPPRFPMAPPPLPRRVQELNPHTGFATMPPRLHYAPYRRPTHNRTQNQNFAQNQRNPQSQNFPQNRYVPQNQIFVQNQSSPQHAFPIFTRHISHPNPSPRFQSSFRPGQQNQQHLPPVNIILRPSVLNNLAGEFRLSRSPYLPFMPHPPKTGERSYRGRGPHAFNPNPPELKDQYAEAKDLEMQRIRRQSELLDNDPDLKHPGLKDGRGEPVKISSPWAEGNTGRGMETALLDVQRQAALPRVQAAGQHLQAAMGNPASTAYQQEKPFLDWETPRVPTEWDIESPPGELNSDNEEEEEEEEEKATTERIDADLTVKRAEAGIDDGEIHGMVEGMSELTRYPRHDRSSEDKENQFQPVARAPVVSFKNAVGFRQALGIIGATRKPLHGISFWDQRPDGLHSTLQRLMRHFWTREGYKMFQLELNYTSTNTGRQEKWVAFEIECATAVYNSRTGRAPPANFPTAVSWVAMGCPASHVQVQQSTHEMIPIGEGIFKVMRRLVLQNLDFARGNVPFFEFSKGDEAFLNAGSIDAGTPDWQRRLAVAAQQDKLFWEELRSVMAAGCCRIITTVEGGDRINFEAKKS